MKNLSRLFIFLGILCYILGIYNIWLFNDPNRLSFSKYTYAAEESKIKDVLHPKKIIIKDLSIDLPIIESEVVDNVWETTDKGASYLASSPVPGEKGNSVIYGHNWASLFGNLVYAHPGQEIEIVYRDNSIKKFKVIYTSEVTPDTSSILAPTEDKRITLYTCTGFLDSKRFVAVATLSQ